MYPATLLLSLLLAAQTNVERLRTSVPAPPLQAAEIETIRLAPQQETTEAIIVDAALYSTVAIIDILSRDTPIRVRPIPLQYDRLERVSESVRRFYADNPEPAAAIVTYRSALPEAGLFPAARSHAIATVEIDAASPLSGQGAGIASLPDGDALPWLSLNNLGRSLEIVAADLAALAPTHEARIADNLNAAKRAIFALQANVAEAAAALDDPYVSVTSAEANMLLQECGFFVTDSDPAFVVQPGAESLPADACVKSMPLLIATSATPDTAYWEAFLQTLEQAILELYDACQP